MKYGYARVSALVQLKGNSLEEQGVDECRRHSK